MNKQTLITPSTQQQRTQAMQPTVLPMIRPTVLPRRPLLPHGAAHQRNAHNPNTPVNSRVNPSGNGVSNATGLLVQICNVENFLRAWRKVKANGGMPGMDGENLRDFERDLEDNLGDLRADLLSGQYQPQGVRKVFAPKGNGEKRPITILTIRDRIAQRAVANVLGPLFERRFNDCSFGFRPGRSLHDAAGQVITLRDQGLRCVVDGDIQKCFDNLDHRLLLDLVRRDVKDKPVVTLIERWLMAHVFNELSPSSAKQPNVGAAQGGVLSPLLCNVYLHPFDEALTRAGLALVRYADDWVILCRDPARAEAALNLATRELDKLRLKINLHKTRVTHFDKGFCFLGVFFLRDEHFFISPGMTRKK